jgi:Tol biopolymer transport system component
MLDERTLIYVENQNDVANLWKRPLEGGTPRQRTRFTSEFIFMYVVSRDGKFAISRGTASADVILIKDFRW